MITIVIFVITWWALQSPYDKSPSTLENLQKPVLISADRSFSDCVCDKTCAKLKRFNLKWIRVMQCDVQDTIAWQVRASVDHCHPKYIYRIVNSTGRASLLDAGSLRRSGGSSSCLASHYTAARRWLRMQSPPALHVLVRVRRSYQLQHPSHF
jgi:hypothetical protein